MDHRLVDPRPGRHDHSRVDRRRARRQEAGDRPGEEADARRERRRARRGRGRGPVPASPSGRRQRGGDEQGRRFAAGYQPRADEGLHALDTLTRALASVPEPRTLAVTVSRSGDDVVVSVVDNGPGISDEDLPKIFIPFFTTRSRGHGIGLALTQKIVLAHGGRIAAERPVAGAAFRIVLPAGDGEEEETR